MIRIGEDAWSWDVPQPYTSEELTEALTRYTPEQLAEHLNERWAMAKRVHHSYRVSEGRAAAKARREVHDLHEQIRKWEALTMDLQTQVREANAERDQLSVENDRLEYELSLVPECMACSHETLKRVLGSNSYECVACGWSRK